MHDPQALAPAILDDILGLLFVPELFEDSDLDPRLHDYY